MALNISKFLNQFFMEAKERLSNIQAQMMELENNPRDKDAVLAIQRDMHTIKGSARMVGLKEISKIGHLMEEVFILLSSGRIPVTPEVMTILYRGVDGVAELLKQSENKQPLTDSAPLLASLQEVVEGKVASPEEPPQKEEEKKTNKKKFKLDFNALKNKFKDKIPPVERPPVIPGDEAPAEPAPPGQEPSPAEPAKKTKRAKPAEPEKTTEAAEQDVPAGKPSPPPPGEKERRARIDAPAATVPEPPAPAPHREIAAHEAAYLKIPTQQVEGIINQVTDLLSRRYFFTSVLQTTRELSQLTRGLRTEWQKLKTRDSRAFQAESEGAGNIDRIVDLFGRKLQDFDRDYQDHLGNFEGALRDVYENLLDVKLTPLSTIFNIYPRFVRDYAYRTGKKIKLYVRGGDTQLDKTVIERINEPLVHLLRNACDHGIEAPETRKEKGKSGCGTIIIEANKRSNHVEIKISDDGAGLDRERIVEKAVARKLVDPEVADQLQEEEIFDIIFRPGFSTAAIVTDTSGRGIGMDIVKRVTQQFGGNVRVQSPPGEGTTFLLEFPVSIFTNKVTYIREEDADYAIPSNLVRGIVKLSPGDIKEKTEYSVVIHKDEIYTVAKLSQVLSGRTAGVGDKPVYMLLPKITEKKIGIIVDDILHEGDVIVKDLGRFLGKRRFVYGMVIGERGELQIVLDIHDIVESEAFSRKVKIITPTTAGQMEQQRILVVDDSMLVREMEKNLLESAGYYVVTAVNGLDGYNKALTQRFDLVMADIEMPEMDGFEMIENIKKIEEYADVPTIVLSTVEKEEDKIRGINLGVNAWLQKQDFNERELLKTIKRFIG